MRFLISSINYRLLACVWLLLCSFLPNAGAREFRVADNQAPDYPTVQALQFMARLIEERSGGRHWLRVFHSRRLGEEQEQSSRRGSGPLTSCAPMWADGPLRSGRKRPGHAFPVSLIRAPA